MTLNRLLDLSWIKELDLGDPYTGVGLGLMLFGVPFMLYSHYVLLNVTFTAIGMTCLVLGSVFLLTPANPVPIDAVRALMDGSYVNIEALLEELDLREKAVYVPRDDRVYCFVPRSEDFSIGSSLRLVQDDGLMVFPPGSELIGLGDLSSEVGVEDALTSVLVDYLEACEGVRAVVTGDDVVVSVSKPVSGGDYPRIRLCMGSLTVNVSGSVLAFVLGEMVRFVDMRVDADEVTARYRVMRVG